MAKIFYLIFAFRIALHSRSHLACESNCACRSFVYALDFFPRDDGTHFIHLQLYTELGKYFMCLSG